MRAYLVLLFVLSFANLSLLAQDELDCSPEAIESQVDAIYADYSAARGTDALAELSALNAELAEIETSCTKPVDLAALSITAGTPDAICEQATPAINPPVTEFSEAEQVIEQGVDYQAIFCTDLGAIYFDLFEDRAPVTVNNLVFLARNNYYNQYLRQLCSEVVTRSSSDSAKACQALPDARN